jgi:hypothetical protein
VGVLNEVGLEPTHRRFVRLGRQALLRDAAAAHHDEAVGHRECLFLAMRPMEHGPQARIDPRDGARGISPRFVPQLPRSDLKSTPQTAEMTLDRALETARGRQGLPQPESGNRIMKLALSPRRR